MAAMNKIGFPVTPAPPDVPSMPTVPGTLVNYLKVFNTWVYQQLESKVPQKTAVPSIMLVSPSGYVFQLTVNDAGNYITTQIPTGSNPR